MQNKGTERRGSLRYALISEKERRGMHIEASLLEAEPEVPRYLLGFILKKRLNRSGVHDVVKRRQNINRRRLLLSYPIAEGHKELL